MHKDNVAAMYLMYIQPFKPTESRVVFTSVVTGSCNTDELEQNMS